MEVEAADRFASAAEFPFELEDRSYDFLILVMDPDSEAAVASAFAHRMDDALTGTLPGAWEFLASQDEAGFQRLGFGKLLFGGL